MVKLLLTLIIATLPLYSNSQSFTYYSGLGFDFLFPSGELSDNTDAGFGISYLGELESKGAFAFTLEGSYFRFLGDNKLINSTDLKTNDINLFCVSAGARHQFFNSIYLETRAGLAMGDYTRAILIPAIGLRINQVDFNVSYQVLNDIQFFAFRAGIYFGSQ